MESTHRLRITRGCLVAGQPCREGEVIEVGDEVAYDLLNLGVAEVDDAEMAKHFRRRERIVWIDREAEQKPKFRLLKTA